MRDRTFSPPRRRRVIVVPVVTAVVLAGGLGWAGGTVLAPAAQAPPMLAFTTVAVEQGTVSSTMRLNAEAVWTKHPAGANQRSGVVTSVDHPASELAVQGSKLYSVDLRPVFVGSGAVPSFRSIEIGTEGRDVQQLQQFLHDLGFYNGDIDGIAGKATASATADWQRSNDLEPTGVLDRSDIVFVPTLPSRISLDDSLLSRGTTLAGGEQAVLMLPDEPTFTLSVSVAQSTQIAEGAPVELRAPDGSVWHARAGASSPGESGASIRLHGAEGPSICFSACDVLGTDERSLVSVEVAVLAPVDGLVVPVAALRTGVDGRSTVVVDQSGAERPVEVIATARGMSVITGVKAGTAVRLPVPAS